MRLNLIKIRFRNITYRFYVFMCIVVLCVGYSGVSVHAGAYGSKILALYKSSDGFTENNNPIKWHCESTILRMGLKIEYMDFDKGFDYGSFDNVRAVLTWYNNAVVQEKDIILKYARFLNRAIDSGVKLVIINSFGAYGYKDGKKTK